MALQALWAELRPSLAALAALSFFINLLYLVPAIFMLQVFDRVIPSGSGDTLVVLLVGTAIALGLLAALDYVRSRLQHVVGGIFEERLSPEVVSLVVARAARRSNGTSNESVRDIAAVRAMFSANGLIALLDAPWVVVFVAVIWLFHPALGLAAAAAAAVMLIIAWLNDRASRKQLESLQGEGRRASSYLESSLRNAEVLQALGMTRGLLERWRNLQERIALMQDGASCANAGFSAATRCVRQAVQILMLALGAWLVLGQDASAGVMIATTILLGRAVQPVEQLVASWRVLTDARAAFARLSDLLKNSVEQNRVALPRPQGRVTVEGLAYRAPGGEAPILYNVNLALAPGEALAIVGPSAAGKSTLARLLTGVWAPSAGAVRLDGVDVSYWAREELGPWIGYVPQDVELFDGTVAENIARLGTVDATAVVAAAKRAQAHDMILALAQGYDTPIGPLLSPGQRQRIALARALYGQPCLVVLDEPNSNLDGAGELALAQAMLALRNEGVTTIVITHRPSLLQHAHKVLVLANGRVQEYGPAAQLIKAVMRAAA